MSLLDTDTNSSEQVHIKVLVPYTGNAAEVCILSRETGKNSFHDFSSGRMHVVQLIESVKVSVGLHTCVNLNSTASEQSALETCFVLQEGCGHKTHTPSYLRCMVKTRQWQDQQWNNKSDREPSAYHRVLKHLHSSQTGAASWFSRQTLGMG